MAENGANDREIAARTGGGRRDVDGEDGDAGVVNFDVDSNDFDDVVLQEGCIDRRKRDGMMYEDGDPAAHSASLSILA